MTLSRDFGVVARDGAKLPTVNETCETCGRSVIADPADPDDVDPQRARAGARHDPVFETLATRAVTGPDDKKCATCCRLRVSVKTNARAKGPPSA